VRITVEELYPMLWEVVRNMGGYYSRRDQLVREVLVKHPGITVDELSLQLGITRGEALILLRSHRLWHDEVEEEISLSTRFNPVYRLAAVGGTFDELHVGHLALLNTAFRLARRVLIGVTSDEFASRLVKEGGCSPMNERVAEIQRVLRERGWLERGRIVRLDDAYGPLLTDPEIDVLVAGPIVLDRAEEAASRRSSAGLPPIALELSPLVLAEDGRPVSSTRVRLGEIDRLGRVIRGRGRRGI